MATSELNTRFNADRKRPYRIEQLQQFSKDCTKERDKLIRWLRRGTVGWGTQEGVEAKVDRCGEFILLMMQMITERHDYHQRHDGVTHKVVTSMKPM